MGLTKDLNKHGVRHYKATPYFSASSPFSEQLVEVWYEIDYVFLAKLGIQVVICLGGLDASFQVGLGFLV